MFMWRALTCWDELPVGRDWSIRLRNIAAALRYVYGGTGVGIKTSPIKRSCGFEREISCGKVEPFVEQPPTLATW